MMRVALIRREYITHLDGVNRFIAWLAEGLVRLGHEVFLASWCFSDIVERDNLSSWFKRVHGLDVEVPIYALEEGPCIGDPWARMMFKWWRKGRRLLVSGRADVAIVNGALPLRFKPKVAVAHGPIISWSLARRLILKILYSTFDKVVCVSEETKRQCSKAGILECDEIIPLPIKLDLYRPLELSRREDIIVHIGTRPVKNPDISVKVVEELRKRGLSLELAIIGPRSRDVETLTREKNFVKVFFDIDEREKINILCSAKAFILPSSAEAFPLSTLEAMACGTPVVVSSAVPREVVVNEYNGLVINGLDLIDYANALEKILREEDLWVNMSRNELYFVNQFDYVKVARKYEELLKELIK